MNAKTMALLRDRNEQSTRTIAELKRLLQESNNSFMRLQALVGCGHLDKEQTEEAIKRMSFERTTLETNYKQHVELVNALATCPLPRDAAESNQAYALRVGEALKDAKLQWEHDQRRIAQLETRESEINELHDTIESLKGFPMQPEEQYSEYLQRMNAARMRLAEESSKARETNEALQGQLTLRSQIIARVMMDPATDKLFNERDWSDAARTVLIDARALCGDTAEANAVTKEPQ